MLKYAVACSALLIVMGIAPAYAAYEAPTSEERTAFDQLLVQFDSVDAPKKDVTDVIGSFQKAVIGVFSCGPGDADSQVVSTVKTKLARFDESTVHQDLVTGGSYTWNCSEMMQGGKVSLTCNNELRINPKVIFNDTGIDPRLHNIENMVILYHELLHGQLMIDAIKGSAIWQKEACNMRPGSDIDYSFADPDHKIINYLQTQFASELVGKAGGMMVVKEISPDGTQDGAFTVKVLNLADYPSFENDAKITLRTNNILDDSFSQVRNSVFLSGHLKDGTKPAMAWFYIFNGGKVQNVAQEPVPAWAKRVAGLWSSEEGHDGDFYSMVDYLIEHNMVAAGSGGNSISAVPHWFKKTSYMWFTGEIDDSTFVNSVQYLVAAGVIA